MTTFGTRGGSTAGKSESPVSPKPTDFCFCGGTLHIIDAGGVAWLLRCDTCGILVMRSDEDMGAS